MKRLSIVLTLALLGLLLTAPAVQAAPPTTAFSGEWIGQDPAPPDGDGSTLHLFVSGGVRPNIEFIDDFGTICENAGSPVTVFTSRLRGFVEGDTLYAAFNFARCGPVPLFLIGATAVWTLDDQGTPDPSDDTLIDDFGTVWQRV